MLVLAVGVDLAWVVGILWGPLLPPLGSSSFAGGLGKWCGLLLSRRVVCRGSCAFS